MTAITATMVKELRDRTGAGMMDCKTALTETQGDMEKAVDWLRKKGLAKAAKKAGRVAADGLIGVTTDGKKGAVVEVNSETDFVARNGDFQEMVRKITSLAPKAGGDLKKLLAMKYPGGTATVEQHVQDMIATIGEKLSVRRTATVAAKAGLVAEYTHNKVADGLGKIGVLVALDSKAKPDQLAGFARQIAMHVAARNPVAIDRAGVPADIIAREKEIVLDKNEGKPSHVLDKIAEGAIKAYAKEHCLLEQTFVHDDSKTVGEAVEARAKELGQPIKITAFARYALGEGIDKKDEDFAAEVAKAAAGAKG